MEQKINIANTDVYIEGNGAQTIVMLHGWPDTYRLWDKQVAFFKNKYRCVRFSLPGYEPNTQHTQKQIYTPETVSLIINQIIDEISPDQPVILMLHDWGCVYGYHFYMQHPEKVCRIIGIDIGDAKSKTLMQELNIIQKLMIATYQGTLATAWKIGGRVGDVMTRSLAKALRSPSEQQYIHAGMNYPYYLQMTKPLSAFNHMSRLNITCPLFYAYGRIKPFMFHSNAWLKQMDSQTGNKTEGFKSDHWVMVNACDAFNQSVGVWLES